MLDLISPYIGPQCEKIWSLKYMLETWAKVLGTFIYYRMRYEHQSVTLEDLSLVELTDENVKLWSHLNDYYKHDIHAFLELMEYIFQDLDIGKYYAGLTSSDLKDTAYSLMMRDSINIIRESLNLCRHELTNLGLYYSEKTMLIRTHGKFAEEISVSSLFENWNEMFLTSQLNLGSHIYYGKFNGSVGESKYFQKQDLRMIEKTLYSLSLEKENISTQIISRDLYQTYFNNIAILAGSIHKIVQDLRLMQIEGVDELITYKSPHQRGSSSMPHKVNPVLEERICGLTNLIISLCNSLYSTIPLWNYRDISHSAHEKITCSIIFGTMEYCLDSLRGLLKNLQLNMKKIDQVKIEFGEKCQSQKRAIRAIQEGQSRDEAFAQAEETTYLYDVTNF